MKKIEPKDVTEIFTFFREENNGQEPTKWSEVTIFNKLGIGIICIDGNFGAINSEGKVIIPLEYDNLIDFEELESELVLASKNNLWGYISWENEVKIPFEYSYASVFENNRAKVSKNNKSYIINSKNQILEEIDGIKKIN